nr:hypothetical protein [Tanacetum cinerariifolium]
MKLKELIDLCTYLCNKVLELESKVIDIKSTYKERIEKLEVRVDKLEEENRVLKELHIVNSKVDIAAPAVEKEKSLKQGRIIIDIDEDVEINLEEAQAKPYRIDLEHQEKVLSMQDADDKDHAEVEEVLEVVKAAKLMTEVVTTAGATTTAEATKVHKSINSLSFIISLPPGIGSLEGEGSMCSGEGSGERTLGMGIDCTSSWIRPTSLAARTNILSNNAVTTLEKPVPTLFILANTFFVREGLS